jgi:hypothetical protein
MKDFAKWMVARFVAAIFIAVGAWLIGPQITTMQALGIYLIVSAAAL